MPIMKEMVYYQTLLLQIVGWLFRLIEKETKNDAEMITGDIQAIQTTLENLWDLTKQSTITRIFEVHQSELKISRTVLCERLGIDEQMYQPSTRENRPEHLI